MKDWPAPRLVILTRDVVITRLTGLLRVVAGMALLV